MSDENKSGAAVTLRIAGVSDVFEVVSKDGALALLLGAPAAEAISKVISGAASIPEAWLRSKAKAIETDQAARDAITSSMGHRIASLAPEDAALVNRASVRWLGQALNEQANLEAVGAQAAGLLQDEPTAASESVSDDFLNRFVDAAGKASSEQMRALFASVLAGEIRAPGRFSLAALHLFSIMDKRLANLIQRYSSITWANQILITGVTVKGVRLQEIRMLESFGLVTTGLSIPIRAEDGKATIYIPGRFIYLHFEGIEEIKASAGLVTELGKEVFGLVAQKSNDADLAVFFEDLKSLPNVCRISHTGATTNNLEARSRGEVVTYWAKAS